MHRKDYEKVADVLAQAYADQVLESVQTLSDMVGRFSEMFKEDNDRFDVDIFRRAVDLRLTEKTGQHEK